MALLPGNGERQATVVHDRHPYSHHGPLEEWTRDPRAVTRKIRCPAKRPRTEMSRSAQGQVTSFGSRSVNGGNGAEATDQDFVVCVRFPVCGDQKQTVGFRPIFSRPE